MYFQKEKLLVLIDDKILLKKIQDLLARKKSGVEMGKEKAIPEINDFIKKMIDEFDDFASEYNPLKKPSADYLNNLLWDLLQ